MNDASMHFIEIKGTSLGKEIKKRISSLKEPTQNKMKKVIMFLYIYFLLYSTFLLLYSWAYYEMIGLWAQTHPQPLSDCTFISFMITLSFQLGHCQCIRHIVSAITTFIDILMLLSIGL